MDISEISSIEHKLNEFCEEEFDLDTCELRK